MNDLQIWIILVFLGPNWAPGATIHQRRISLAIWCVLILQWAVGATAWTTFPSVYYWAFCIPSDPQEPLYEPHAKLYMGILGPQLALGATIYHCHVYLAIPSFLGPPWAIGATRWTICRSNQLGTFCVPSEPLGPLYVKVMYMSLF